MIQYFIANLTFLQPAFLSALLFLPLLWYILKISPPVPRIVVFPAFRFLDGLVSDQNTPRKTPLFILLLRMLIVAILIFALARPVLNQAQNLAGHHDVRIIIENDWASAQIWDMQINAAKEIITQAEREGRRIYILTTTVPSTNEINDYQKGPFVAPEALSVLAGLNPNPWVSDYKALSEFVQNRDMRKNLDSIWLSHGLNASYFESFANAVQDQGTLTYISPPPEKIPLLIRPSAKKSSPQNGNPDVKVAIGAPTTDISSTRLGIPVTVQVLNDRGQIMDAHADVIKGNDFPYTVQFDIPQNLQSNIARFEISGRRGAGVKYIIDNQFKKKRIGIATLGGDEQSATPFIESGYYLSRAFAPFGIVTIDTISQLLTENVAVLVLPDIATIQPQILNDLEQWIKDGGFLVRFAGANMAQSSSGDILVPTPLRSGGRALSGSLSWDTPQKITSFAQSSPLYGLEVPSDVHVSQQVLADPAYDFQDKIWAQLEDGTPFITASAMDRGLVVLIHTTANADWSNFAISGLYVNILERIASMAGRSYSGNAQANQHFLSLDPILIMDGFGTMLSPSPYVKPLPADKYKTIHPSADHPPGLYGHGGVQYALNLGDHLSKLEAITALPFGVLKKEYERSYETNLMPYLLYSAVVLFLIDWVMMMFVAGRFYRISRRFPFVIWGVFTVFGLPFSSAYANEAVPQNHIQYASGFYLAYIESGDNRIDLITEKGLNILSETLSRRTSIEPAGVASLNPETDELAFFPILYWAIVPSEKTYSGRAIENIQRYLNQGGVILFDTRNSNASSAQSNVTDHAHYLQKITSSLNIPSLTTIPDDHVLGRAFYLLDDYPGYYTTGTLWVEKESAIGRDNVSSVLIGGNDWARSWAESDLSNRYGGSYDAKQKEMALRFGVNLVMYAMTGNYKADQVHIPHILERLGR